MMGSSASWAEKTQQSVFKAGGDNLNEKYISKKYIFASYFLYMLGIIALLLGMVILILTNPGQSILRFISVIPAVGFLISGALVLCEKCKCPYCGFGRGGRLLDGQFHRLLSISNIKKGNIHCQKCQKTF